MDQEEREALVVIYWKSDPTAPGTRPPSGKPDRILLTRVQATTKSDQDDEVDTGLEPGDMTGMFEFPIPSEATFARTTIEYGAALGLDDAALAQNFCRQDCHHRRHALEGPDRNSS